MPVFSAQVRQRAKTLGYALHYKYSGFVQHSAFEGNSDEWILINELDWNDSASTHKRLKDVMDTLDKIESNNSASAAQKHA